MYCPNPVQTPTYKLILLTSTSLVVPPPSKVQQFFLFFLGPICSPSLITRFFRHLEVGFFGHSSYSPCHTIQLHSGLCIFCLAPAHIPSSLCITGGLTAELEQWISSFLPILAQKAIRHSVGSAVRLPCGRVLAHFMLKDLNGLTQGCGPFLVIVGVAWVPLVKGKGQNATPEFFWGWFLKLWP